MALNPIMYQDPVQQSRVSPVPQVTPPNRQITQPISTASGSSGLSTGQILGGLGATALGGLFGGASGAANVLGSLGSLYGSYVQGKTNEDINRSQAQALSQLSPQLQQQIQFKPFTVTSSTGQIQTTPEGGYGVSLSPEQQALQNQLFGQAQGLFQQVGGSTAGREADVYERIRALQRPAEERQRLATEERMAAQGRLGLSSAAYGGSTPELIAQQEALNQARNMASLSAIQQAQAEQAQAADLGRSLLGAGYVPQAQMLNMLQPAVNLSNIASSAQQQQAIIAGELQQAQMALEAQAAQAEAQRRAQMAATAGGLLTAPQTSGGPSALESIFSKMGSLFGGSSTSPALADLLNYNPSSAYTPIEQQYSYGNTGGLNLDLSFDPNALNNYASTGGLNLGFLGGKG